MTNGPPTDPPDVEGVIVPIAPARAELERAAAARDLRNPVAQYLATLRSPHSRRMMLRGLRVCLELWFKGKRHEPVESFPWQGARYQHTNLIRSALAARFTPPTANLYLASLRGVLKTCWKLRLMSWEDYGASGSKEALPAIRGSNPDVGRRLTRDEQAELYKVCERDLSPAGRRDAAMLAVMLDAGLRRSEVAALQVADINRGQQMVIVRKGKGGKSRALPLTGNVSARVTAWCRVAQLRTGPLFLCTTKTGRVVRQPLTGRPVDAMLKKRAAAAGISGVSPHDTRRTFATDLDEAGVGLERIRDLLGHVSIETTRRYIKRDGRANVEAVERLVEWRQEPSKPTS